MTITVVITIMIMIKASTLPRDNTTVMPRNLRTVEVYPGQKMDLEKRSLNSIKTRS